MFFCPETLVTFVMKSTYNISPNLKHFATLPCEQLFDSQRRLVSAPTCIYVSAERIDKIVKAETV